MQKQKCGYSGDVDNPTKLRHIARQGMLVVESEFKFFFCEAPV